MAAGSEMKTVLCVDGMCCADEQTIIEKKLKNTAGVTGSQFNLVARKVYVTHSSPVESVIGAIGDAGFAARRDNGTVSGRTVVSMLPVTVSAILVGAGLALQGFGTPEAFSIPFFIAAIVYGGRSVAIRAWKSLRLGSLDMNVLMSLAVIGAAIIDRWAEGASVIVLFALSQWLEEKSMERTRRALSILIDETPAGATVLRGGAEQQLPVAMIAPGDEVIVKPGEKIPVDGEVIAGHAFVREAAITGEPLPAEKRIGSRAFAGTLNERGMLHLRAEKIGEETTYAHIVHLVEEAQAQRSASQQFVERFSRFYTPAILGLAVLVALVPPLAAGAAFGVWFYRALVLLVIACPCALVISTPVTIVSALTAAARGGILIKGGKYLEEASRVRAVVFDKTGTLTYGTPAVTDVILLNAFSEKEVLRVAAAAEWKSEHAVAKAILERAAAEGTELPEKIDEFMSYPGRGVSITLDGERFFVGNHQFAEEHRICSERVERHLDGLEADGKSTMVVFSEREPIAIIGVADKLRSESSGTMAELRKIGIEQIVMLSGDGSKSVERTAQNLGITEHFAGLLPEEKVGHIRDLARKHGSVAMVGDGINDAPALASASLGIAMGGSGSDVALETADVVLMNDELPRLSTFFRLSRRTMRMLRQNVALALGAKLVFLLLGIFGLATLWMAVFADDGVTLIVILNSLRLLRD